MLIVLAPRVWTMVVGTTVTIVEVTTVLTVMVIT